MTNHNTIFVPNTSCGGQIRRCVIIGQYTIGANLFQYENAIEQGIIFSSETELDRKQIVRDQIESLFSITLGYTAPKYVLTNTFTDKSDVYSFGMVLLEVACTNYKNTIFDKMIMLDDTYWFSEKSFNPANFLERFPADEIIDPIIMRLIAPQCLAVFMDIMKRCLNIEPNERPAMGEVEVELEHALALQEEADFGKSNGDFDLFPSTSST